MRLIFFIGTIALTLNGCSQIPDERSINNKKSYLEKETTSKECSPFYSFNDTIIDLKDLNAVLINPSPNTQYFKDCSKYKNRFRETKFWFKLPSDSILKDKYCTYEFVNDFKVKITNPDYEVVYADFPVRWKEGDEFIRPFVISMGPNEPGIVAVYERSEDTYFHLIKMNYNGEILAERKIEKIILDKNGKATGEHLYIYDFSEKQLVFSSIWHNDEHPKTVIANLEGLMEKEVSFDKKLTGVAWDENEEYVKGIVYDPLYKNLDKQPYFSFHNLSDSTEIEIAHNYLPDAASCLLIGNSLIVAGYHPISTGSWLVAIDIKLNQFLWEADVLQLNTDHSKYYNSVVISKYENKIIMEGNEAHGDYLQIFDFNSGKRLAEFGVVSKK